MTKNGLQDQSLRFLKSIRSRYASSLRLSHPLIRAYTSARRCCRCCRTDYASLTRDFLIPSTSRHYSTVIRKHIIKDSISKPAAVKDDKARKVKSKSEEKVEDVVKAAVEEISKSERPLNDEKTKKRAPRATKRVVKPKVAKKGRLVAKKATSKNDPAKKSARKVLASSHSLRKHAELYARLAKSDTISPKSLTFEALEIKQPPIPKLSYNLDRVLFSPGVHKLRDSYSGVYNFDPYLEDVMPANEFDYNALNPYKTSSEDTTLTQIAGQNKLKYVGSTSSMTSMLTHFHFLLSHWRELDLSSLSAGFRSRIGDSANVKSFTEVHKGPSAIFLRHKKDGTYAVDVDKLYSSPNILMVLGHSLEKVLTVNPEQFERFRKGNPEGVPEDEHQAPQSYHYTKQGKILMRSQLDAYDPRLPGSGVFDLKTRAVLPIRMLSREYDDVLGYQLLSDLGEFESYEREMYDMYRSTFLKYSLQVRMGRMQGIFVTYHNVEEIFGFQFMNLAAMDRVLHGQEDSCLGDQEFRLSISMVNDIFDRATKEFPNKSIQLHFDTRTGIIPMMYVFAEPMEEDAIDAMQSVNKEANQSFVDNVTAQANPEQSTSTDTISNKTADTTDPPPKKPLLAWTLVLGSTVNNQKVARPESLRPQDTWEIKYDLKQAPDLDTAWSWYTNTKERRRKVYDWGDEASDKSQRKTSAPSTKIESASGGMTMTEAMNGSTISSKIKLSPFTSIASRSSKSSVEGNDQDRSQPTAVVTKEKKPTKGLFGGYYNQLKNLAQHGRKIRDARREEDKGRDKIVVGWTEEDMKNMRERDDKFEKMRDIAKKNRDKT